MQRLPDEVVHFFHKQTFTVISTVDKNGFPHNSCKGIIKINRKGQVFLLDLYKEETFKNLKRNRQIAVTAVDEHKFKGFCLKGKAKIVRGSSLSPHLIRAWEKRIAGRTTQRVLRHIAGEKRHFGHPEILLPKPEYMIVMQVEEVVNLTPHHLNEAQTYGTK